ncbi:hypothetical protein LINGRAHAP2_LOCUS33630 [Linum grandiflorum]
MTVSFLSRHGSNKKKHEGKRSLARCCSWRSLFIYMFHRDRIRAEVEDGVTLLLLQLLL